MIQIYKADNTDFENNGDMTLMPTAATISAELNGSWEAQLEHPLDEEGRWKFIEEGAVVKMPSFLGSDQMFRVKSREKTDSGVTAELEPIFYDSMDDCFLVDVRPTNKSGQDALDMMTAPNSKYSGVSDITRASTAYYQFKNLMEAINGDDENSFIKRWGGEILFDNFTVKIYDRVGGDYGVELRYGKNIPQDGMSEEVDIRDVVTRIYPKAYNGYTMTGNGYVDSPLIENYPVVKAATITFNDVKMAEDAREDDAENGVIICNSQTELDAALQQRCEEQFDAGLDKPQVAIRADMVLLAETDAYQEYSVLETVSLGDTVHCHNNHLGIATDARVIQLQYDAIRKKVSAVVLGDFRYDYFRDVSSSVNRIDGAIRPDGTVIAEKIAGFLNGAQTSLRAQYNVAQKQDVMAILFENLDTESLFYGALAIGTQGLMISKTRTPDGRGWDWTSALTANGLMAGIIVAGIISDKLGRNSWNLDTGEFITTLGTIGGWGISNTSLYKDAVASDGTIYRVFIQPPSSTTPEETWFISIQKSEDGGKSFYGIGWWKTDGAIGTQSDISAGGNIAAGRSILAGENITASGSITANGSVSGKGITSHGNIQAIGGDIIGNVVPSNGYTGTIASEYGSWYFQNGILTQKVS